MIRMRLHFREEYLLRFELRARLIFRVCMSLQGVNCKAVVGFEWDQIFAEKFLVWKCLQCARYMVYFEEFWTFLI